VKWYLDRTTVQVCAVDWKGDIFKQVFYSSILEDVREAYSGSNISIPEWVFVRTSGSAAYNNT
jgi:hypothetical protein